MLNKPSLLPDTAVFHSDPIIHYFCRFRNFNSMKLERLELHVYDTL